MFYEEKSVLYYLIANLSSPGPIEDREFIKAWVDLASIRN
jgi:hypothetical protein